MVECLNAENVYASEMTYIVSGGALNSSYSLTIAENVMLRVVV